MVITNKKYFTLILGVILLCGIVVAVSLHFSKGREQGAIEPDAETVAEEAADMPAEDSAENWVVVQEEEESEASQGAEASESSESAGIAEGSEGEAYGNEEEAAVEPEEEFQQAREEYVQYIEEDGSVKLPETVTQISAGAFSGQKSVTAVDIPKTVTSIGEYAFSGTAAKSITIPAETTEIGANAFKDASNLQEIEVAEGNTSFKSEEGILYSADGKTLVAVPAGMEEVLIPNEVTEIKDGAISGNTKTIYGNLDSAAEIYAKLNGILFINAEQE